MENIMLTWCAGERNESELIVCIDDYIARVSADSKLACGIRVLWICYLPYDQSDFLVAN